MGIALELQFMYVIDMYSVVGIHSKIAFCPASPFKLLIWLD